MKLATRALARLDKKFIWHPFTQMKEWAAKDTVIIRRGRGSVLVDTDGKRYLDGVSSLWCNVHGHRVAAIDRAITRQLGSIAHSTFLGLSNVPAIRLSEALVRITPKGLSKVFYSDSGSEAVEIALKMAYQFWQHKGKTQKTSFLRLTNAYHGDTIGSVSVGGIDLFHRIFKKLIFKSYGVKAPDRYHENFKGSDAAYARITADRVEKVLKAHAGRIAAIVMEPRVQGAAGMITHPAGYLRRVRRLAERYGTLLILDEVATGFGRTGTLFACESERVRPDILCLAKGLTGGYLPLAATLTTDRIYNAFLAPYDAFKAFFHGHTYTANPLACAAACANLAYFRKHNVLEKITFLSARFAEALEVFRGHPHVGDIRQIGLMAGIEMVRDKRRRSFYPVSLKIGARISRQARKYGILIRPLGNVVVLMPPYCFTPRQIKKLCMGTYQALCDVTGKVDKRKVNEGGKR